jgi:hypothetical protein
MHVYSLVLGRVEALGPVGRRGWDKLLHSRTREPRISITPSQPDYVPGKMASIWNMKLLEAGQLAIGSHGLCDGAH